MHIRLLTAFCAAIFAASLYTLPASAAQNEEASGNMRVEAVSIAAEVIAIDHDTRELSVRSPLGEIITITAGEQIERLNEIAVGDSIVITYIASLEGELRKPTEEELAEPWVELDAAAIASKDMEPGALVGTVIRAVCTIEGMNRVTRTIMIKDPRGKYHMIADVEPEKMEGVTLGTTIVLTYTQAVAVSLKKKPAAE